ncbi:hypothetical protein J3458_019356 [Metarhizium acridum]|uniref:uncharacterized protein n=1 Tax=Metarhizium acridum TaxID=92637 RepID=UPI001C6CC06F|nr:hypothetical protein J3458_019356 [Metarhizium acridum]
MILRRQGSGQGTRVQGRLLESGCILPIKQRDNDSSKLYNDLSDTAKAAAAELRSKQQEKKEAKEKREQELRDEKKTGEDTAADKEVKRLAAEIED